MSTVSPAFGAKAVFHRMIEAGAKMYLCDLKAMSHEQLSLQPAEGARCAYDFTFEVVALNERFAKRFRGEDPGPWPFEDWVTAPENWHSPENAAKAFEDSMADLRKAFDAIPEEKFFERITLPNGETSFEELCRILVSHLSYHDGQLNLIQIMTGDSKVHWDFD